jgi:phage terminase small subunit
MDHQTNQADVDNLDWQTKVTALQVRVDQLTDALTRVVGGGGSGSGRRISEDPDKFGGTEKDISNSTSHGIHKSSVASASSAASSTSQGRRLRDHQKHFDTVMDNPYRPA